MHGRCLVVAHDGGAHTVVWPSPGTRWDPARHEIVVNGVTARVGTTVSLVGGEGHVTPDQVNDLDWVVPPAPECLENLIWWASAMALVDPI